MNKLRLTLVRLGHFKHSVDLSAVTHWNSRLFEIVAVRECNHAPDGDEGWQEYQDDTAGLPQPDSQSDVTIAITEYSLEDNFYLRRLASGLILMSLAEVGTLLEQQNVPIGNFILRNIYTVALIHYHEGERCPVSREGRPAIIHDETRCCLFDMNGIKSDVLYSAAKPCVCSECRARLDKVTLPEGALKCLAKELGRLRKPMYYRMADFVKRHPVVSLSLAFVGGLFLELIGNAAYDFVRSSSQFERVSEMLSSRTDKATQLGYLLHDIKDPELARRGQGYIEECRKKLASLRDGDVSLTEDEVIGEMTNLIQKAASGSRVQAVHLSDDGAPDRILVWEADPRFRKLLDEQRKAIQRGVSITRLFILTARQTQDASNDALIMKHRSAGVHCHIISGASIRDELKRDFAIFDGSVLLRADWMRGSRIVEGTRSTSLDNVRKFEKIFQELLQYSTD